MCYLQREPHAFPEPERAGAPPRNAIVRPRWVAAAGMALAAALAAAALVASPPAQAPEPLKQATGLLPIARPAGTGSVERTALPADDDVPTSVGNAGAGARHCHESL